MNDQFGASPEINGGAMKQFPERVFMAGSRQCRHQIASRITDIQLRQRTPQLLKLDGNPDRQVMAGC